MLGRGAGGGGTPAIDRHPIQGGVDIVLVSSCYRSSRAIQATGFDAEFTLKVNFQFEMYLMWSITLALLFLCADELMDVREECAKFGVVRGFKYDGDSTAGYKVT